MGTIENFTGEVFIEQCCQRRELASLQPKGGQPVNFEVKNEVGSAREELLSISGFHGICVDKISFMPKAAMF